MPKKMLYLTIRRNILNIIVMVDYNNSQHFTGYPNYIVYNDFKIKTNLIILIIK